MYMENFYRLLGQQGKINDLIFYGFEDQKAKQWKSDINQFSYFQLLVDLSLVSFLLSSFTLLIFNFMYKNL